MHATVARRRFDKSLDLVAARPELFVDLVSSPSSTDNAWSMLESPFLRRDVMQAPRTPFEEPEYSLSAPAPAISVAPLNIKKMRRRGLLSGIHLVLPKTPLPPPTPRSGHTPQTSLTFTAELDATGGGFLFTPITDDEPTSALSTHSTRSPVPDDIDGEFTPNDIESEPPAAPRSPSSRSSASSSSSRSSTLFNHGRKRSDTSTCASSVFTAEDAKPLEDEEAEEEMIIPATEEAINMLESELQRAAPIARAKSFDHSCFTGMDDALLLDPWQAFDSLCWTASVDHFPGRRSRFPISPTVPVRVARPPKNVPLDSPGASIMTFQPRTSHFSVDDHALNLAVAVPTVRSSRYGLHMPISSLSSLKALKFPRRMRK
ncbi:hypothetical protein FOMPIDRAFT_1015236 [Fomitopsis schrenkii]|uniref:Uncharacterized protein n=1 Tax=Fomitopsis schrenkii TaxID=2126942 RepID=S8FVY0_FOMSC|nr:hypothetical protein FOMPIDRAFT_1015236 [Fomitopsis schrenkii]